MTDFVDGLHLTRDLRANAGKLTTNPGKAAVGRILTRANALQEQLDSGQVTSVGHVQVAVILRMSINNGVVLTLFFCLVFPVGIHG